MKARIRIDESRLNFPLTPIAAGKLSSLDVELIGVPNTVASLLVYFEHEKDDGVESYAAGCRQEDDGTWSCYVQPFLFPDVEDTGKLHYHVVATDVRTAQKWLGTGQLRVLENPAGGSPLPPPIIPADTYVRNPVTGLYHKLTAEVNELGEITVIVSEEGEER